MNELFDHPDGTHAGTYRGTDHLDDSLEKRWKSFDEANPNRNNYLIASVFKDGYGAGWSFGAEHTFASIMAAINATEPDKVPETLCRLGAGAKLTAVEMELLAKAAGKKAGVSYYSIKAVLKASRGEHDKKAREKAREAYVRDNPKFIMENVREDQPILPTKQKINEVLSKVKSDEPPMRDAYNWPTFLPGWIDMTWGGSWKNTLNFTGLREPETIYKFPSRNA